MMDNRLQTTPHTKPAAQISHMNDKRVTGKMGPSSKDAWLSEHHHLMIPALRALAA
jgi:hypothetical protein